MSLKMKFCLTFLFVFVVGLQFVFGQEATTESNYRKIVEGFKGLWRDFVGRFSNTYKSIQDFSVNTKQGLINVVNETENYLALSVAHKQELLRQASVETRDGAQRALDQITGWYNDVASFKTRIVQSTYDQFASLKQEWMQKVTGYWNQGLNRVIEQSRNLQTESG